MLAKSFSEALILVLASLPFFLVMIIGPYFIEAARKRRHKEILFRGDVRQEDRKKHYYCHKCGNEIDYNKATCDTCGTTLFASEIGEKYKPIKVKVIIKAADFELSIKRDYTEYAKTLIECNNTFASTGTKMTESNIREYFRPGTFSSKDIDSLNGDHFLFGFVETIAQEPKYANLLSDFDELTFVVE